MTSELNIDADLEFRATAAESLDFSSEEFVGRVGEGFNDYGVRKNLDENDDLRSVDVIFAAMEPGPPERRKGVRITEQFLRDVAQKDYDDAPPHLLDHRQRETFAKIGDVEQVWFSELQNKLMLRARIPNTGARTHNEAIARYTFEPPSIRNGSIGFGGNFDAVKNDDGEPELVDGAIREFSTVNFPGGYDEGGVAPAFAEEAVEAAEATDADFDDPSNATEPTDGDEGENLAADGRDFSVTTDTVTF